MKSKVALLALFVGFCFGLTAQEKRTPPVVAIRGQVVMFDWWLHSTDGFAEDFVVRVTDDAGNPPKYIRVVYPGPPLFSDADDKLTPDEIRKKYQLPKSLFVARGDVWRFRLIDSADYWYYACARSYSPIKLSDVRGKVEVPPFVKTPGALGEEVPPVESLRCFVLEQRPASPGLFRRE